MKAKMRFEKPAGDVKSCKGNLIDRSRQVRIEQRKMRHEVDILYSVFGIEKVISMYTTARLRNKLINTVPEAKRVLLPNQTMDFQPPGRDKTMRRPHERCHKGQTPINDDSKIR